MNSEKVKEIKKVLEMFAIDNKEMTLFQSPVPQGESCVKTIKYADILTLINELESENEILQQSYIVQAYDNLRAENKKLRNQITCQVVLPDEKLEEIKKECLEKVEVDKDKLLKEFAEMLKENITIWYSSVIESIDDTLKEFINE